MEETSIGLGDGRYGEMGLRIRQKVRVAIRLKVSYILVKFGI